MTPGARLQAAIDLLGEVGNTPRPADAVISAFFRNRRYIGAKDRSAVAETVYSVLRHHARLHWWMDRTGHPADPRALVLADQILAHGRSSASLAKLFDGGRFTPPHFSAAETRLARALDTHTLDHT
ncbi:MAG TPA: rRNA cytosine-C5-methylase, partial [Arenibaculum sp.]|nr:rRNA cytosine-C5-methylase [Arenibaculum sp.]